MDIAQIVARKRQQLAEQELVTSLDEIREMASRNHNIALDFKAAATEGHPSIIPLLDDANGTTPVSELLERARQYGRHDKAKALAVRPEGTFLSQELAGVGEVHEEAAIPVLFMDWVIDEYQIYAAQIAGADAIVLTACLMDDDDAVLFTQRAKLCGMQVAMRCFTLPDVQLGCEVGSEVILADLRKNDGSFAELQAIEPMARVIRGDSACVALTDAATAEDARKAYGYGAQGVIPSLSFMDQPNVKEVIRTLSRPQ